MPKCMFQPAPEHCFVGKGLYCSKHTPTQPGTIAKFISQIQGLGYLTQIASMTENELTAFFQELVVLATKELNEAGEFVVPGLGKLVKSERKARMGRNPQTGVTIQIPKKAIVKFRVGKRVRDSVNAEIEDVSM